jgi:hypothetical protein
MHDRGIAEIEESRRPGRPDPDIARVQITVLHRGRQGQLGDGGQIVPPASRITGQGPSLGIGQVGERA